MNSFIYSIGKSICIISDAIIYNAKVRVFDAGNNLVNEFQIRDTNYFKKQILVPSGKYFVRMDINGKVFEKEVYLKPDKSEIEKC